MSAFLPRLGRGLLVALAVAALLIAYGLWSNPRAPWWLIALTVLVGLLAASAAYWTGLIGRHRAPLIDRHTELVPGCAIGWTPITGSCSYGDTVVYPADPHGPLRVGTVDPVRVGQLRAAPNALALRVRAIVIGGLR